MKKYDHNSFDESIRHKVKEVSFQEKGDSRAAIFSQIDHGALIKWPWLLLAAGLVVSISSIGYLSTSSTFSTEPVVLSHHRDDTHIVDTISAPTEILETQKGVDSEMVLGVKKRDFSDGQNTKNIVTREKNITTEPTYSGPLRFEYKNDINQNTKGSRIHTNNGNTIAAAHTSKNIRASSVILEKRSSVRDNNKFPLSREVLLNSESDLSLINMVKTTKNITPVPLPKVRRKYHAFLDVSPFFTYQKVKPNNTDDILLENFKSPSTLSTDRIGVKVLLGAETSVTNKLSLFSGLSFQNWQLKFTYNSTDPDDLTIDISQDENEFLGQDVGGFNTLLSDGFSSGSIIKLNVENDPVINNIDATINNIGIATGARLKLGKGGLTHELSPSLEYQYLLNKGKISNEINDRLIRKSQLFINFQYASVYRLGQRMSFKISPSFSYSMLSTAKASGILSIQPFSAGITTGIHYRLR